MKMRAFFGIVLGVATAAGAAGGEAGDFYNIVMPNGADPFVYRHDDGWYYIAQSSRGGVVLRRSRTISGLGGGESRLIWEPTPGTPFSRELWAPEVHFLRGKWYIYVAADDGDNANHRMYALENASADPFEGAFLFKGKVADPATDRWAIDGTVLRMGSGDAERLYFVWSGWEGLANVDQRIYIAPMRDPLTIAGPRVELSRPTLAWEKAAGPPTINEGPQPLVRDGRAFIVYSAAGSWSDSYCLGLLSLKPGAEPLDASSWRKSPEPVFAGANGVVAPGHCSFTKSPDGSQDWIAYHAAKRPGSGWSRSVRIQPFGWGEDGSPAFGDPTSPDRPIPLPSGEPKRLRLEAESARLEGSAKAAEDASCSGGSRVEGLGGARARATLEVAAPGEGTYVVAVRYRLDGAPRNARVGHRVLVDDRQVGVATYPDSGGERWSNAFVRVPLKAGANRLSLAPAEGRGGGGIEVDCLDVVLDPLPAGEAGVPVRPRPAAGDGSPGPSAPPSRSRG